MAAHILHGVVEVHAPQVAEAYRAVGKSAKVCSHASSVVRSYPAAKAWQVSIQTPTRDLSSTRSMIRARWAKSYPRLEPWPACVFDDGRHAMSLFQCYVYRLCYAAQALVLRIAFQVAAGWRLRRSRPSPHRCILDGNEARDFSIPSSGVPEVYQVAVVGQYLLRRVAVLEACGPEAFNLFRP